MARIRTSPAPRPTPRDRRAGLAGSASGLIGRAAELRELPGAAMRAAVERRGWVGLVGGGKALFAGVSGRRTLELVRSDTDRTGRIVLSYRI